MTADLEFQVDQRLRATGHLPLRELHVCIAEGLVILRGCVPTYYLKQLAQAVVLGLPGVNEVQNDVDVVTAKRSPV